MMDNGSAEMKDLEPWKQSLSISGLKKFTLYNITVSAYTSKGDGVSYSKVIMTDQDGMFDKKLRFPMMHCVRVTCSLDGCSRCSRGRIVTYFCDILDITNQCTAIRFCLFF